MRDDPLVTERGTAELNPKMLVSRQGREFDRARLTFLPLPVRRKNLRISRKGI